MPAVSRSRKVTFRGSRLKNQSHQYNQVNVSGGNVVLGNYHAPPEEDIFNDMLKQLLDSLYFPEMNIRFNQIVIAHQSTFEWVFGKSRPNEKPHPRSIRGWISSKEPIFWISGKPGSGKSTLMKFIQSHDKLRASLQVASTPAVNVLGHYFWMTGSDMQWNLKGCLCSLLHQLILADARTHSQCLDWVVEKSSMRPETTNLTTDRLRRMFMKHTIGDWTVHELKDLLYRLLNAASCWICIFLDGLDEYDQNKDPREILKFLSELSSLRWVKICVSSRPDIVLEKALSKYPWLRLQDLTKHDCEKLARERLTTEIKEAELGMWSEAQIFGLAQHVAERAEGVFLWVIMAIKSLMQGIWSVDDIGTLRLRLDRLPREMSALYQQMLSRLNHDQDFHGKEVARLCILQQYSPLNLLTLALAANQPRIDDLSENTCSHSSDLNKAFELCEVIRRRVQLQSAGLLTAELWPTTKYTLLMPLYLFHREQFAPGGHHGLCTCRHRVLRLSFRNPGGSDALNSCLRAEVQPVHRTVLDFFRNAESEQFGLTEVDVLLTVQDFIPARLMFDAVCRASGCDLNISIRDTTLWLQNTLSEMCLQACAVRRKDFFATIYTALSHVSVQVRPTCDYGFYHEVFSCCQLFYDLLGLFCSLGHNPFLWKQQPETSEASSYYKGYLLICAARGKFDRPCDNDEYHFIDRTELILWLCTNGADLETAQVVCIRHELMIFLPRPPFVECLLFIVRLLTSPIQPLEHRLLLASRLANCIADIAVDQFVTEVNFTLHVLTNEVLRFDSTPSLEELHESVGNWFAMQMPLPDLKRYVFDLIETASTVRWSTFPALASYGCRATSSLRACDAWVSGDWDAAFLLHIDALLKEQVTLGTCTVALRGSTWRAVWDKTQFLPGTKIEGLEVPGCLWHVPSCPESQWCQGVLHGCGWSDFKLVAPEYSKEIKGADWYTKGVLRDWHRRRELQLVDVPQCVLEWELNNDLVPVRKRTGSLPDEVSNELYGESNDQPCDDPNNEQNDESNDELLNERTELCYTSWLDEID